MEILNEDQSGHEVHLIKHAAGSLISSGLMLDVVVEARCGPFHRSHSQHVQSKNRPDNPS